MAILTFDRGEGLLESFGQDGHSLEFSQLFSNGRGRLSTGEALHSIQRIRGIEAHEAEPLCRFLLRGKVLSEFRHRMAPEDWDSLLAALPEPEGIAS